MDIADRARAQARARQEGKGLGFDFTKPGSAEVAQQARNERDHVLRQQFTPAPWRDAEGRLRNATHGDFEDVSPELKGGLKTTRAAYINPANTRAIEEDARQGERERIKYTQKKSTTPQFVAESEDVPEHVRMRNLLDAQAEKDREARKEEVAKLAESIEEAQRAVDANKEDEAAWRDLNEKALAVLNSVEDGEDD